MIVLHVFYRWPRAVSKKYLIEIHSEKLGCTCEKLVAVCEDWLKVKVGLRGSE